MVEPPLEVALCAHITCLMREQCNRWVGFETLDSVLDEDPERVWLSSWPEVAGVCVYFLDKEGQS